MKDWRHILQRFRLLKFNDLSKEEVLSYEWDTKEVKKHY
jgi:hypothetical protein